MTQDDQQAALLGWAKFLNPETLRTNLIAASIFLAAYELLRSAIVERIRTFFSHEFRNGEWIPDQDYETKCLALDKSPIRASLLWLKTMDAVDDSDIARFDDVRRHRNELAHDLPNFLITAGKDVSVELLGTISQLLAKIETWWLREVEMSVNPAFDHVERPEDVASGTMLYLHMMIAIASGQDSAEYWKAFQQELSKSGDA